MNHQLDISTDKARLDLNFIHAYLSEESYWAKGRTFEEVRRSIEHSTCFGAYLPDGRQVAFARVVTDQVVFAWLMDVFVSPSERGRGFGKQLVAYILNHPDLRDVNGFGLRTEDAHGLYRRFGFEEIPKVQTWMLKKKPIQLAGNKP